MDKLQWFKFSPSSWMMGRIQRCSEIGQARFMRLCCSYWNHGCNMTFDDAQLDVDEDILKELIDKKVITSDDEYIYISFLDDQYLECEKSSEKGKLFALKRWNPEEYNKMMGIATDKPPKGESMGTHKQPNAEKKREDKIRKEKKRFTPPTLLEVKEYFKEKGYSDQSAIKAFDYYDIGDWKDSNGNKVKNWKQKMQGVWFKDENKMGNKIFKSPKIAL